MTTNDWRARAQPWRRWMALALCTVAGAWPFAVVAEEFPWQQIYTCSMYSSSVSEFASDQGRDGSEFEREFDQLVNAALYRHKTEYLKTHPAATAEALRSAWEADTNAVEGVFEASVDRAPDAVAFLKKGYNDCTPLRTALLRKP